MWLQVFPYFRLAPVLLAVWGLLIYARKRNDGALILAFVASTLGILWSLDTGLFAVAGTTAIAILLRPPKRALIYAAIAIALPFLVLLALRADIRQFLVDSFVIMPKAIDATWALAAPLPFTANGVRYFLPPIFYGFALALAFRAWRNDKALAMKIAILAIFSILLFRTAAGRVSWSHTRFAVPLLGIMFVAFILEPMMRRKRIVAAIVIAIPLFLYFEIAQNTIAAAKFVANWHARQSRAGLVAHPLLKRAWTTPENANDLKALNDALNNLGPREATIFDFSNERALYFLLNRKSPTRCMEISMLSVPDMLAEAMGQLNANPPLAVIVSGYPEIAAFDGVSNRERVPELAAWIDANYPKRYKIGRFELATKQ